jgi:hypothetical protein
LSMLPPDLEQSARAEGALKRCRNVPNAAALIRTTLAYALSDLSIKDVAAWATAQGVMELSGPRIVLSTRTYVGLVGKAFGPDAFR